MNLLQILSCFLRWAKTHSRHLAWRSTEKRSHQLFQRETPGSRAHSKHDWHAGFVSLLVHSKKHGCIFRITGFCIWIMSQVSHLPASVSLFLELYFHSDLLSEKPPHLWRNKLLVVNFITNNEASSLWNAPSCYLLMHGKE